MLVAALAAGAGAAIVAARLLRCVARGISGECGEEALLSPLDEALAALRALKEGGISQDDLFMRLSAALRRFLRRQIGVDAPQMTSGEVIGACSGDVAEEALEVLAEILAACDLAEFALYRFSAADISTALDSAERLVREIAAEDEA